MLEEQKGLPMRLIGQQAYPTPYINPNAVIVKCARFAHRRADNIEIQILKDNGQYIIGFTLPTFLI
jgi:hypothetical protein